MTALVILGIVFFATFMMIVFRGAPYVPTKATDVEALFTLLKLKPEDVIVDLGSGDGRLLLAAAKHGVHAVGYELNPFLVAVSWVRLRQYRSHVQVRWRDFWITSLPKRTKVVFVFLGTPYMKKLDRYLRRQTETLGHDIQLVSYGVPVPGRQPDQKHGGLLIYTYKKA